MRNISLLSLLLAALLLTGAGCFQSQTQVDTTTDDTRIDMTDESEDTQTEQPPTIQDDSDNDTMVDVEVETDTDTDVDIQAPVTVSLESGNFFFAPETITTEAGGEVTVTFEKNDGFHTFVIDEIGFKSQISEGQSVTFVAPSEPGEYAFYCDVGNHRAQGMEGVLIVE